jgi:DNA-directed RNA polymerase subunit RPC12/RpoP
MSDAMDRPARNQSAHFPCAHCKGKQIFDVVHGMLRCPYCGAMREVPGPSWPGGEPVERSLADGLRLAAAPPPSDGTASIRSCPECGAQVVTDGDDLAGRCSFCDTPGVVTTLAHPRPLRPDSVLPFCVEKKAAALAFGRWLRRLWLRPSDLRQVAALEQLSGVYVPFWIFAAEVDSQWTAESGRHYYVEEDGEYHVLGAPAEGGDGAGGAPGVQGGPELPLRRGSGGRRVRKTRWRSVSGRRADVHREVMVCASRGLPGALAERLGSYNLRRLVPYAEGYLAGFAAEAYAVDLLAGHLRARERMDAVQLQRCANDVEGDTQRHLVVRNRYTAETFRCVLLPVWIATYRYHQKLYRFVVSGQTAEVVGQAPYSRLKVGLVCLLGLAVLLVFLYLQHHQPMLTR